MSGAKAFATEGVSFPLRIRTGPNKGTLAWTPLRHHRVLQVLHNPRYAGAFVFGRRKERRGPDGRMRCADQPRDQWLALILDAHVGYITWAEFEANEARLAEQAAARGEDRRASPPREGPALLQGIVVCGRCCDRMTVRYRSHNGALAPTYVCQRKGIEDATPVCQSIAGEAIDRAVSELLLETVTPLALEVALAVQAELEARAPEAHQLRRADVERARHAAELARRRYLCVDPDNRLVAATLEADWNDALRQLSASAEDYERHGSAAATIGDEERARITALATDFPRLWSDPRTPDRERKRMVRLLLDDVTLLKGNDIAVHVRHKGGRTTSLAVALPLSIADQRRTPGTVVEEVDRLLDHHTDAGVVAALNAAGILSGTGQPFNVAMVRHIRSDYSLRSHEDRRRDDGLVGLGEIARRLGVCTSTVKRWHSEGLIEGEVYNDKGERLYRVPAEAPFKKIGRPPKAGRSRESSAATNPGGAV